METKRVENPRSSIITFMMAVKGNTETQRNLKIILMVFRSSFFTFLRRCHKSFHKDVPDKSNGRQANRIKEAKKQAYSA